MNKPQRALPPIWYDYTVQAWVEDGKYSACGHPVTMRANGATCCYAGTHAGETADWTHYRVTPAEPYPPALG